MILSDTCDSTDCWLQFLEFVKKRCSTTAFDNWFASIKVLESNPDEVTIEVPNIFVKEYLLTNYKKDLCAFLPVSAKGEPAINFVIKRPGKKIEPTVSQQRSNKNSLHEEVKLNQGYRFDTFIEGPSNQFVKSAAMGVASRPGRSYNPLFIHGGVGVGKTHIIHGIGHDLKKHKKTSRVQCITTEAFINDLVDHLRNKSVERMKRFYRSGVDILLVDDIQFLQNRVNFEEEFCNTFETLINQNKQIVITSDKPPSQLKLSERMIARMEWGLVAHLGMPELETRVAILQNKAQNKGLQLPNAMAFFIAENIYDNVRQLEGVINRLSAQCRLLDLKITEDLVEKTLNEMLQYGPRHTITVEQILKSVAAVFQVKTHDIRGSSRTKDIALARQVAMYLARKLIPGSLRTMRESFGKTHSTMLHAYKTIEKKLASNETLRRQIHLAERTINS